MLVLSGCSGQTVIMPNPPDAEMSINGNPMEHNTLHYGRWIGNNYILQLTAPGFETQELHLSPRLGHRAGGLSLIYLGTIIGIPLLPTLFWNGELDARIYVPMKPSYVQNK